MRFVGSTSPVRNLLQNCVAAADLARRAGRGQSVVIDSCGFVSGRLAEEFQYSMIDLLRPDLIVILGGSAAIERICVNFSQNRRIEIDRIPPAEACSRKSSEHRHSYRNRRLQAYFAAARGGTIHTGGLGLHGHLPELTNSRSISGRLFAFLDSDQLVITLGIAQRTADSAQQARTAEQGVEIEFIAPPFKQSRVRSLQFGTMRLAPDGAELQ